MLREPIDLPPIVSVELIQISDKTNIPYAPKARKIIEETKKKEEGASSEALGAGFNCGYCQRALPVEAKELRQNTAAFKFCTTCKAGYHRSCAGEAEALSASDASWQCELCVAGLSKEAQQLALDKAREAEAKQKAQQAAQQPQRRPLDLRLYYMMSKNPLG